MFSKGDQRSWLKIYFDRGKNVTECYPGLLEAYGENAFPYRKVARWVEGFCSSRNETVDLQFKGWLSIPQDQIDILSGFLYIDRRWTVRELSLEVSLSQQMVWYMIKKFLKMRKIAGRFAPHQLTEV
ncbi:HTH_48 domain-containing protein [Trichonephila clavipes]|nr:HTH_48 domain-containing protein [Trichonephila clavipes]